MFTTDRRAFLRLLGSSTTAAIFPQSIDRALAIPAHNSKGSIEDVEHIVFLMQENRAFDHYFGTLRGVRGYGDPHPMRQPSGDPVWYQADGNSYLLPFHPTASHFGSAFLEDTPHGWTDTHAAWNLGKYDQWIANKGPSTMAYYTRKDIPFFYALADAFTICDAYHCSLLGATDPNRYHMWTGWVGNNGLGGGPVVDNAEEGYDWSTYPERLERAGISWKIYQDSGVGLDAPGFWGWTADPYIGNYGDNSLLYFHQYQNATPGQPLYEKARRGTNIGLSGGLFDILKEDVRRNALPQVSWIVAPEAYSEHGNWPANYGAWYVSQVLDALTSNPRVFSKTVLFIMYDENDGFFDHMVPATPPGSPADGASTVDVSNEIFPGNTKYARGPYGLGIRVPMIVVSPWSKGGWVCSEVFDHTSLIRFLEKRFAKGNPDLIEKNITAWRRTICGDLTSAFDFATPNTARVNLPSTAGYAPPDRDRHDDYIPKPPNHQSMPQQEEGLRYARALPYALQATGSADSAAQTLTITFDNLGTVGACFMARPAGGTDGPSTFTVASGKSLSHSWSISANPRLYDVEVHGPNGFFRAFKGSLSGAAANIDVACAYGEDEPSIELTLTNRASKSAQVTIANVYGGAQSRTVPAGQTVKIRWDFSASYGWYDLTLTVASDNVFERRLAGHIETGEDTISDPQLGS